MHGVRHRIRINPETGCTETDRPREHRAVPLTESGRRAALNLLRRRQRESGRISDADPEVLRYLDTLGINLDSPLRVLTRCEFAGMISVAVSSGDGAATTVELGSPAARALWTVG